MDYKTANEKLQGRCRESRKLSNNTYLKRRGEGEIAVRLHSTDILTFYADGRIEVNTGGWNTVTTKDRINSHLSGWSVWSEKNEMFIGHGWSNPVAAFEGNSVTIEADGSVTGGVSVEQKRREIRDAINEARRPVNRARYWINKARTVVRDSSACQSDWCQCHPRRGGRRQSIRAFAEGICDCGCKFTGRVPSAGKLTVADIMQEANQTVRTAKISIYGLDRFILESNAAVIAERDGYQLLELKFSNSWWDRMKALKMQCPSTKAIYLNTVPPNTETVEQGLRFMYDLPEGVDYFETVAQQA